MSFRFAGSNPNNDSPSLEIEFERYGKPVSFPSEQEIQEFGRLFAKQENLAKMGAPRSGSMVSWCIIYLLI